MASLGAQAHAEKLERLCRRVAVELRELNLSMHAAQLLARRLNLITIQSSPDTSRTAVLPNDGADAD